MTKSAHFLAIQESSSAEKLADFYLHESFTQHGISVSVVSGLDVLVHVWFLAEVPRGTTHEVAS